MRWQTEGAPGVAEDQFEVVARGELVVVPAGTFRRTIRIREFSPVGADMDEKVFTRRVGLIVDGPLELVRLWPWASQP